MIEVAWLWFLLGGLVCALVAIACLTSLVIRLESDLNDTQRTLRTVKQAYAMDVQALTKKLQAARAGAGHE